MEKRYKKCAVTECYSNAHRDDNGRSGYCCKHYHRHLKFNDTSVKKETPKPAHDWLMENKDYLGNECLKWPFHIGKDGYGRAHNIETKKLSTASRLMCAIAHGEPPSNKHEAAHKCGNGNKGCVNPNHLYWATPTENQNDMVKHNTTNRGENYGRSKLTSADVIKIRELLKTTKQIDIAKLFNVDPSHISDISRRKKWSWLK